MRGLYDDLFDRYPLPWQMRPAERLALIAILERLKPSVAIEVGSAQGGSLQVLAAHAEKVYALDTDPTISDRLSQFGNVEFRIGEAKDELPVVLAQLQQANQPCRFILIDGNHATEAVQQDIQALLSVPPLCTTYVLLHDSFNPDCRQGIRTAGWEASPYAWSVELDFVSGWFHAPDHPTVPREMWGGFALAMLSPEKRVGSLTVRAGQAQLFDSVYRVSAHWRD